MPYSVLQAVFNWRHPLPHPPLFPRHLIMALWPGLSLTCTNTIAEDFKSIRALKRSAEMSWLFGGNASQTQFDEAVGESEVKSWSWRLRGFIVRGGGSQALAIQLQ